MESYFSPGRGIYSIDWINIHRIGQRKIVRVGRFLSIENLLWGFKTFALLIFIDVCICLKGLLYREVFM